MCYDKKHLKEPTKPLYGFSGKRIKPIGVVTFHVSFGTPQNPYRVHNLRCGRHSIPLQCPLRMRAIEHLQSCPAFRVPLPQGSNHLRHNNSIQQPKGSQKRRTWFCPGTQKCAFLEGRRRAARASTTFVQAEDFIIIQKAIEAEGDFRRVALEPRVPDKTSALTLK
jgi:hypothetical protein